MLCNFKRDGEILVCQCCNYKLKTKVDNVKMMCKGGGECEKKEYPSIYQMGLNAMKSIVEFAKDGLKIVDEEEQGRRMEICSGNQEKGIPTCEKYDQQQNRCLSCGCFLALKTKISSGGCPIGKW